MSSLFNRWLPLLVVHIDNIFGPGLALAPSLDANPTYEIGTAGNGIEYPAYGPLSTTLSAPLPRKKMSCHSPAPATMSEFCTAISSGGEASQSLMMNTLRGSRFKSRTTARIIRPAAAPSSGLHGVAPLQYA